MTDMELRSNIIALLKKNIGFGIELFSKLWIDELENGDYRVSYEDKDEFISSDAKKAVDYFLKRREELQLGYDFEREPEVSCPECGTLHQKVRPGKTQPDCECHNKCKNCSDGQIQYRSTGTHLGYFCDKCGESK